MQNRMQIDGVAISAPSIAQHGHGCLVVENRWQQGGDRQASLNLAYERTVVARAGFLCEPNFDASSSGVRTLRCTHGEIFLVVVDVRRDSPTFGRSSAMQLRADDFQVVKMPAELACGYLVTSEAAAIDERFSHAPGEQCQWLDWRDPELHVDWPETAVTFASHGQPSARLRDIPPKQLPLLAEQRDSSPYFATGHADRSEAPDTDEEDSSEVGPVIFLADVGRRSRLDPKPHKGGRPKTANVMHPGLDWHRHAHVAARQSNERILVLGSRGQLGRELCRELQSLGSVIGACRRPLRSERQQQGQHVVEVDLTRPASLRGAIRDVQPTLIVNACAMTDIEECERNFRSAQLINATAPMLLAEEAGRRDIPVVHFCTSLVYGGGGEQPWCESDAIAPDCHYARTKSVGTQAVCTSNAPHLVLRTDWLYSSHSPNLVGSMIEQALTCETLQAPADMVGTPTAAAWLAAVTAQLLQQAKGSLTDWLDVNGGLLHATPTGFASGAEVAQQILMACRSRGMPVSARSVHTCAAGPGQQSGRANRRLDCSRLAALLGCPMPSWQSQLDAHIRQIKNDQIAQSRPGLLRATA